MLDTISLPLQTMFAEVEQRSLAAVFDEAYPDNGSFSKRKRNGREYWYYNGYDRQTGAKSVSYVGPAHEPDIARRVERFHRIKADVRERRRMVKALTAAGLPSPDPLVGDVVEALWRAEICRDRCVLIGATTFQTYAGLIGVLLPMPTLVKTGGDEAPVHSISLLMEDSLPPVLDVLRSVEVTFQHEPHHTGDRLSARYRARDVQIEFLMLNRVNAKHPDSPMPLVDGATEPPGILDYLIANPARSVLLHRAAIPVRVPAPERYAVYKLVIATLRRSDRRGQIMCDRDIHEAGVLFEALASRRRHHDVLDAWMEAWGRGPKWQATLLHGRSLLRPEHRHQLHDMMSKATSETRDRLENIGFTCSAADTPHGRA